MAGYCQHKQAKKKNKAFRFGLFSLLTKHRKETLSGYLRYNQYSRIHHLIARKNSFFNASGQLAPPSSANMIFFVLRELFYNLA